jgi:hypothetical protein
LLTELKLEVNMKRWVLAMLGVVVCTGVVRAKNKTQKPSQINGNFVTKLLSPINTKTARKGDAFTLSVEQPSQFLGGTIHGSITKLKKPKRGGSKGKAEVAFQFDTLTFDNQTQKINAVLVEVRNSQGVQNVDEEGHVIGKPSHKKRDALIIGLAVAGALAGARYGGAAAGVAGAAAGAAAGAVIGREMTVAGSDIEFRPGSLFVLNVSGVK